MSAKEHDWVQASDQVVQEHLDRELARIRAASSSVDILGLDSENDSSELRSMFLSLTKAYHPNRFARRPEPIRQVASEVFLQLKEAYEKARSDSASARLQSARGNAGTGKHEARARASSSRPPDHNAAARQELMDRRRAKLKSRLSGPVATKRTAQIRASTSPLSEDAIELTNEEDRFAAAQAVLATSDFAAAASAFKALAVARPVEKRFRMHMHYAQGRLHQEQGNLDEARAEYKRALGLDANFTRAHEAMSSLPDENKKKKNGILGKLFGK